MPNTEIDIRAAAQTDAADISRLIVRALHEVNARDYAPDIIDALAASFAPDKVSAFIGSRLVLVATAAGEIVGTASLDGDHARSVFVSPDWLDRGIGAALMREVEAMASTRGVEKLTVVSSITAEGFYRRLGYIAVRERLHGRERTIVMEKELRAPGGFSGTPVPST